MAHSLRHTIYSIPGHYNDLLLVIISICQYNLKPIVFLDYNNIVSMNFSLFTKRQTWQEHYKEEFQIALDRALAQKLAEEAGSDGDEESSNQGDSQERIGTAALGLISKKRKHAPERSGILSL